MVQPAECVTRNDSFLSVNKRRSHASTTPTLMYLSITRNPILHSSREAWEVELGQEHSRGGPHRGHEYTKREMNNAHHNYNYFSDGDNVVSEAFGKVL